MFRGIRNLEKEQRKSFVLFDLREEQKERDELHLTREEELKVFGLRVEKRFVNRLIEDQKN